MDVEMALQFLVPGMKHTSKAVSRGPQPLGGRELLGQGLGAGVEEQIEGCLGLGAMEETSELGRQSEDHHEVRRLQKFA